MASIASILIITAATTAALDNGLARTPPMGTNSWTAVGTGVSAEFLLSTASLLTSTGLKSKGYNTVCSDDGWSLGQRDSGGLLVADPAKFPGGISNLTSLLNGQGYIFGIYAAASSVVCSGRPGSLYNEGLDAHTFASWGVVRSVASEAQRLGVCTSLCVDAQPSPPLPLHPPFPKSYT